MKGAEHQVESAGCDGYIAKPIDVRTLSSLIRQFLKEGPRQDVIPGSGTLKKTADGPLVNARAALIALEPAGPAPADEPEKVVAELLPQHQRRQ